MSGKFSSSQRELYTAVLRAQQAALNMVQPGARFLHIHRAASLELGKGLVELGILKGDVQELYERGAIALFLPHGLGHLLGLDVHDMEDLGDRAGYGPSKRGELPSEDALRLDRLLEPNMVVTIEPGFYSIPALLEDRERVAPLADCIDWNQLRHFSDVRGIRIEDDVLVTEAGCEVLSRDIPKEPELLERLSE